MTAILDRFWATREKAKQQQRNEAMTDFRTLVAMLVAGKTAPDQAVMDELLRAAGKSDAELRAAVDRELLALSDKKLAATKSDVVKQLHAVNARTESITAEMMRVRSEAIRHRDAEHARLAAERMALVDRLDAIAKAEQRLAAAGGARRQRLAELVDQLDQRQHAIASDKALARNRTGELADILQRKQRFSAELRSLDQATPAVA